jgi:hypothetical protein
VTPGDPAPDGVSLQTIPQLSDLHIATTHSGGREARPYESLADLFGRGGVYPRPQGTRRSPDPLTWSRSIWISIILASLLAPQIFFKIFLTGGFFCL